MLVKIHRKPTPVDIRSQDLISALEYYGVEVTEREGSRVGMKRGTERIVIHRPHPGSEVGRATVRDIAVFLDATGVSAPRERDDERD